MMAPVLGCLRLACSQQQAATWLEAGKAWQPPDCCVYHDLGPSACLCTASTQPWLQRLPEGVCFLTRQDNYICPASLAD